MNNKCHNGGGGKSIVKQLHQQQNSLFINRISWNEFFFVCLFGSLLLNLLLLLFIFGWSILCFFHFVWVLLGLGVSSSYTIFRSSFDGYMHNFSILVRFRFMLLLFVVARYWIEHLSLFRITMFFSTSDFRMTIVSNYFVNHIKHPS